LKELKAEVANLKAKLDAKNSELEAKNNELQSAHDENIRLTQELAEIREWMKSMPLIK
jgi:predicted  nucleic acid-binding Zn-ribbon protein